MVFGGLAGTVSGVSAGLAATDRRLVPYGALVPERRHDLAKLGFRRVFAGHYHHHCSFEDGKVWSIGATTHQTASDIGTKAGFLLVQLLVEGFVLNGGVFLERSPLVLELLYFSL